MERDIVSEGPRMRQALDEALVGLPQGTQARDVSSPFDDYTLRWDFITEYDPALAPGLRPIAWTKGSWNAHTSKDGAAEAVAVSAAEHRALLESIPGWREVA